MNRLVLISLLSGALCPARVLAQQMSSAEHPRTYCELAADLGYPSRGYNKSTGSCSSNQLQLGAAGSYGLENNLAYYVMGDIDDPTKLTRISLILNVNNDQQSVTAHSELERVASGIVKKLTGSVPQDFAEAVKDVQSRTWVEAGWEVETKHSVWSTGRGYDITIHFHPVVQ